MATRQKFYKIQAFDPDMVAVINRNFEMIFGGGLSGNTLRKGSVTGEHILDRTITGADIALDTIEGENIKDGTIELADLSSSLQSTINNAGTLTRTKKLDTTVVVPAGTIVATVIETLASASLDKTYMASVTAVSGATSGSFTDWYLRSGDNGSNHVTIVLDRTHLSSGGASESYKVVVYLLEE